MTGGFTWIEHATRAAWTEGAAATLHEALAAALAERNRAGLIASGGRTPEPVYARLAATALDWQRVSVTLADERHVEEASALSNAGLLRRSLLTGNAAAARFTPLVARPGTLTADVAAADAALRTFPTPPDVMVLGMGDDMHTASLFPGSVGLREAMDMTRPALVAGITSAGAGQDPPQPRLTMTLRALSPARLAVLLLTGQNKRSVFERAMLAEDPMLAPIKALVTRSAGPTIIHWTP
jgi:6-phosphogluconolactonase